MAWVFNETPQRTPLAPRRDVVVARVATTHGEAMARQRQGQGTAFGHWLGTSLRLRTPCYLGLRCDGAAAVRRAEVGPRHAHTRGLLVDQGRVTRGETSVPSSCVTQRCGFQRWWVAGLGGAKSNGGETSARYKGRAGPMAMLEKCHRRCEATRQQHEGERCRAMQRAFIVVVVRAPIWGVRDRSLGTLQGRKNSDSY